MKEKELEIIYKSKKDKFTQVLEFIEKHKSIKDKINVIENAKALITNDSAKEKIRVLFIDCINAAGGNNLSRNGKASKFFYSKINKLSDEKHINLNDFFACFDNNISNYTELYDYLCNSKRLINFADKKAALFIYKLNWLQENLENEQKIFKNYKINKYQLIIPIDAVILIILNQILRINNKTGLDQKKDFKLINSFFKNKIGNKFILIEDLWFWGYFITKGNGKNRKIEFNEDKFYTAEFLKPTEENKKYINNFLNLII